MVIGWIYDSCLYIFFAVMAATAATKDRPSIQTVLLRILMSWVAAVAVLSQFSLPSVTEARGAQRRVLEFYY